MFGSDYFDDVTKVRVRRYFLSRDDGELFVGVDYIYEYW